MGKRDKNININIKAKAEGLKQVQSQMSRFHAAQAKTAARRATVGTAKSELKAAESAYKATAAAATALGKAQGAARREGGRVGANVVIGLRREAKVAREAKAALNEKRVALQQLLTANRKIVAPIAAVSVAVKGEQVAVGKSTQTLERNTAATERNTKSKRRNAAAVSASASTPRTPSNLPPSGGGFIQRTTAAYGTRQGRGPLGLRPYELTNLSYQINDVVSGLAMGQRPMQIFAQQAGQIIQIFPKLMTGLFKLAPALLIVVPFAAAIGRLNNEAANLKLFTTQLLFMGDGAKYSAETLANLASEADRAGLSLKDAQSSVMAFVKAGMGEGSIGQYVTMAKQLAVVTGTTVPEAAKKLATAFQRGSKGVLKLDRDMNFLTAAQYENIRALEEGGQKTKALEAAQAALSTKLASTAKESGEGGSWNNATKALGRAWNSLLDYLKETPLVDLMSASMSGLGDAVAGVANGIADLVDGTPDLTPEQLFGELSDADLDNYIRKLERRLRSAGGSLFSEGLLSDQIRKLETELAYLESVRAVPSEFRNPATVPLSPETLAGLPDAAEISKKIVAYQKRVGAELERQKKLHVDIDHMVTDHLKDLVSEEELAKMTARERAIELDILEQRNKALQIANERNEIFTGFTAENLRLMREGAGMAFDTKKQAAFEAGGFGSYVDKIVQYESGGNPNAKSKTSTATGLGQFIESTWLNLFKQHFPDRAKSMNREAILALRKDADLSRTMISLYAQNSANHLKSAGVAVTEASLRLSHFLGPQGAVSVLTSAPSTPLSELFPEHVIAANESAMRGKTAGDIVAGANRRMGASKVELSAQAALNKLTVDRAKVIEESNKAYQTRIADLQFEVGLESKLGRERAIAQAVRDAEKDLSADNLALTKERRAEVARLAGELYDAQNAETLATGEVNRLLELRGQILENLKLQQESGDDSAVATSQQELSEIDDALDVAIEKAIAFWQAMGGPQADVAIAKLNGIKLRVQEVDRRIKLTGESINNSLAEVGVGAMDKFAHAIANGENAGRAFFDALRQGVADFLLEIAKAIAQQALLNALMGSGGSAGGGAGGFLSKLIGSLFHDGGVVGTGGAGRMVPSAVFAGAARFHEGGLPGLKSNEVAAILEKGEEVLTRDDSRNVLNGGGTGSNVVVKNINVIDGGEVIEQGLTTQAGEQAFFNFMTRKKRKINATLG